MTVTNRRYHRGHLPTSSHFQPPASTASSPNALATVGGSSNSSNSGNTNNTVDSNGEEDGSAMFTPFPKHVPYPNVEQSSELMNELLIFCFTILASATQFLHLYRSVWWLPNSYNRQAVNFYLIDWDLAIFIDIMASRRLLYCCILKFIDANCPEAYVEVSKRAAKYTFLAFVVVSFAVCGAQIFQKASYIHLFVLSYPLVLYLMIFGLNLEQFLRTIVDTEPNCINGMPLHSCSSNPNSIRTEIDALKTDFNSRCKQVIFTSLLNAYYAGFVPCVLASKHLYYNNFWTTQHLACVFVGGFTMCVTYCFPMRYCDVFHRAALHLGQWHRVNNRSSSVPAYTWSKTNIYPHGTYVRHMGEVYRSVGYCTSAIPANSSHYRFYAIFSYHVVIYMSLFAVQMLLIVLQLVIFALTPEWQNVLSVGFLLLTNFFTLFRIARDYFIARRIYASEPLYLGMKLQ
ncbi:transmembrane protein 39A-like [Anopheles stephensi]|uniref:transmembrane protein 39A n=1 Tax=Anopheles stephensi TaxID=30069 RepID=UPI0007D27F0F|nr:transmembrane protein 39A [Anopheles stephensi]XP_035919242.1 transmembrane protein 39A-like [Anopheles stephensi]